MVTRTMVALVLLLGGCGDDADSDDGSTLETETVRVNVGQGGLSEAADIVVPADAMSLHLVARATGASGKLAFELTQDGALRVSYLTPATADDALLPLLDEIAWGTPASTAALARTPAGSWRVRLFHAGGALVAPVDVVATWRRGGDGQPRGRLAVVPVLVGDADGAGVAGALADAGDLLGVRLEVAAALRIPGPASVDLTGGPDAAALRALFASAPTLPARTLPIFVVARLTEMTPTGGLDVFGSSGGIPVPLAAGGSHGGVAVSGAALAADRTTGTIAMAHEIGHALGLLHTSEPSGRSHDRLVSTPECPPARDADGSGTLLPEECAGAGADNLMFWALGTRAPGLTDEQRAILARSPWLATRDPL